MPLSTIIKRAGKELEEIYLKGVPIKGTNCTRSAGIEDYNLVLSHQIRLAVEEALREVTPERKDVGKQTYLHYAEAILRRFKQGHNSCLDELEQRKVKLLNS